MSANPVIVCFRRDLRLADNPALTAAVTAAAPVIPLYVYDEAEAFAPGGAARWWLHHSLLALSHDLAKAGSPLVLRRGAAREVVPALARETGASGVYWNRRYAPAHVAADKALFSALRGDGIECRSYNASLLREPWEAKTKNGGPFRVYTAFWKTVSALGPARPAIRAVRKLPAPDRPVRSDRLDDWLLIPRQPDWAAAFASRWRPGEAGARLALESFLDGAAGNYASERDFPDRDSTSRLSPHLAFGEIGPTQIWQATQAGMEAGVLSRQAGEKFLAEIGWREFSYHLLHHNEGMETQPLRAEFADFPWRDDASGFAAWRKGLTGYPIVDAGMRQLWRTGWMHNRVRMIVASFLVKHLLIPWRKGERWFWDTLVDADPANNTASWQWVAGCGADAAPYFRIFNPVMQGEKFDAAGAYVRAYVPELAALPDAFVHKPWEAPAEALAKAGVRLGETYPEPIVDHAFARKRALDAFEKIRKG